MYTSIYIWNPFVLWILNPSNRFVSLQKKGRVISFDFQVKRFLMIAYCPKLHIYIYIYSYINVVYTRIYIYTIYNHIQYIYIYVCVCIYSVLHASPTNVHSDLPVESVATQERTRNLLNASATLREPRSQHVKTLEPTQKKSSFDSWYIANWMIESDF